MMDALYGIVTVLAAVVPLYWGVMTQLERWESPESLRRHGAIIKHLDALEMTGEVVGRYLDAPIYGTLGFKGMVYEFAGVVPVHYQRRIDENELYLAPGLLYLTSPGVSAPAHRPPRGALGAGGLARA
jgi:hypothetical protein